MVATIAISADGRCLGVVTSWEVMKQLMNDKFVPLNYERKMYYRLADLSQDENMSVDSYTREFHKLYARCRLDESEELRVYRYLQGLKRTIRLDLEDQTFYSVDHAASVASSKEEQWKYHEQRYNDSLSSFRRSFNRFDKPANGSSSSKTPEKKPLDTFHGNCHKCGEKGHKVERCPHRALKITQEDDEYGHVDEVVYPVEGDTASEG